MHTRDAMNTATTMTSMGFGVKRRAHRERMDGNALRTRICILEAALASIARETEVATRAPEVSFLAIQRIAAVARMTIDTNESS